MPSVYIASSIHNWEQVQRLQKEFINRGYEISFDWTVKRFTSDEFNEEEVRQHGQDELEGLLACDHLLVVLPGGRGTHFEMGAIVARELYQHHVVVQFEVDNKPLYPSRYPITILYGNDDAGRPTTFHHLTGITRVETEQEAIEHVCSVFFFKKKLLAPAGKE